MEHFKEELEKDEEEMYREAMTNAYLLITDKLTFDDLIEYFCKLEEYEKCEEIKKIKDSVDNKE